MTPGAEKFKGFRPESLSFLRELKANNSKSWFEVHRSDYEKFMLTPLRALTTELTPMMLSIDQDLVTSPARVISRIHRDTRFSRDKSPYKSNLWLTFKRPLSDWQDAPAFFFELGADSWRYGMGFYAASRETMDRLRQLIERKPAEFERMIAFLADQDRFAVEGEQYKRLINPAVSEHLRPWHQRKSIYLICNRLSDRQLFDKELLRELITGFSLLAPFYHWLWRLKVAER
ncbi:MAG: DUF2461 domain-containing protein [Pedobacter sp.]